MISKSLFLNRLLYFFFPIIGVALGLIYYQSINRLHQPILIIFIPVFFAIIISLIGNILIKMPLNLKTRLLLGMPAIILYALIVWIIPLISQYPGYGTNIEYIGFSIIEVGFIIIPILLVSTIAVALFSWLGYRIANILSDY